MSTKILSGIFHGQKIITPKNETRPSKSIVRKSLIDQVRFDLQGLTFLDLFAGSGAMGLEALSNGAEASTFVEKDTLSMEAIRGNIKKLKLLPSSFQLFQMDVQDAIDQFFQYKEMFDFIFADPPYNRGLDSEVLKAISQRNILSKGGHFFLETNQERLETSHDQLSFSAKRKFGKSYLYHFYR